MMITHISNKIRGKFKLEKYVVSIIVFILLGAPYFFISHNTEFSYYKSAIEFPLDHSIPFIPSTVWYYLGGLYITIVTAIFLFETRKSFYLSMISASICGTICCLIFRLFPTAYPKPSLDHLGFVASKEIYNTLNIPGDTLSPLMMKYLYIIDKPINTFPSLHVAYGIILYLGVIKDHPKLRFPLGLNAFLLYITTLTTKQHFILDGLAGGALAYLVFKLLEVAFTTYSSRRKVSKNL